MYKSTMTLVGAALASCKMFNIPFVPYLGTTLNDYYVLPAIADNTNEPGITHAMFGLDGGVSTITETRYPPNAGNLIKPIPIFSKPIDVPYTAEENDRFGLKVTRLGLDGNSYVFAYALKLVTNSDVTYVRIVKEVVDGITNFTTQNLISDDITNFNPVARPAIDINDIGNKYLGHTLMTLLTVTDTDAANMRTAVDLLYGDLDVSARRSIVDVGLIHSKPGNLNGIAEIAEAQLNYVVNMDLSLYAGFTKRLEIGGMYPQIL